MNKIELGKLNLILYNRAKVVHQLLGPGLPLSLYIQAFLHELRLEGLHYQKDVEISVFYKQIKLTDKLISDLLIGHDILILFSGNYEIHNSEVLKMKALLRISGKPVGIIIAFNSENFTDGYKKVLNDSL